MASGSVSETGSRTLLSEYAGACGVRPGKVLGVRAELPGF